MMYRHSAIVLGTALVLSGCGQQTTARTSPSTSAVATSGQPSPTSTPQTGPLLALLEARHCSAPEPAACESLMASAHDTIALAGADGFARGKASFAPRKIPVSGNAATVLDFEGTVAGQAAYFVDASGVVRRLTAGANATPVATFPVDSTFQSLSVAVRPDGKQLMAAVLTYPKHQSSSDPNQPFGTFSGPWKLQIEGATSGGKTTTVHQWQTQTEQYPNGPGGFANIWLVGWDDQGPVALVGQVTATQNAWLSNQRYYSGRLAHLNPDGTAGAFIGPADCLPYWRPSGNRYVCTRVAGSGPVVVDVIDLSGSIIWSGQAPAGQNQLAGDFALSPDGGQLAMDGQVVSLQDGSATKIAPRFQPEGWVDAGTLIGLLPVAGPAAAHVGILHLSDPQHPEDWGFTGTLVGVLR